MLVLGIVMLFSTSAFAQDSHGDPVFFVKRQSVWLIVALIACVASAIFDYHLWQRTWWVLLIVSVILLVLCFVPPIGTRLNGSSRWIRLGPMQFQPSDMAKFASVVFLAFWYSRFKDHVTEFFRGFVIPMSCVGVLMALIAAEVDLGTTALIGCTMFTMMFVAGGNLLFLGPLAGCAVAGIFYAATHMTERMGRLLAFMDLEKYQQGAGLQQWQALIAFGSGGVDGLGLGNGRQKMLYVPFAHTDFIFPMIGEELGLRFTLLVVLGYLLIVLCGTIIAVQSRDRFGMLLALGIVVMISLQAIVNIGVTTSMLPNKGLGLPFISYGGSNLLFCLLGVGILVNIWRQGLCEQKMNRASVRLNAKMTPRI